MSELDASGHVGIPTLVNNSKWTKSIWIKNLFKTRYFGDKQPEKWKMVVWTVCCSFMYPCGPDIWRFGEFGFIITRIVLIFNLQEITGLLLRNVTDNTHEHFHEYKVDRKWLHLHQKPWEDQIKVSNEVKTDIMSDKMTLPQH